VIETLIDVVVVGAFGLFAILSSLMVEGEHRARFAARRERERRRQAARLPAVRSVPSSEGRRGGYRTRAYPTRA